jgi:hypothetical protein
MDGLEHRGMLNSRLFFFKLIDYVATKPPEKEAAAAPNKLLSRFRRAALQRRDAFSKVVDVGQHREGDEEEDRDSDLESDADRATILKV